MNNRETRGCEPICAGNVCLASGDSSSNAGSRDSELFRSATRSLAITLALAITSASIVSVAAMPASAADEIPLAGAGTAQSPYEIGDEADFRAFITLANQATSYAASSYVLTDDVVLTSDVPMITNFTGSLAGAGHSVFGLSVAFDATKTNKTAALMLANRGTVSKIAFVDVAVTGSPAGQESAGGTKKASIAANNYGLVDQVYVQGTVSGGWRTGGIVADNFGTVSNSYFSGTIAGNWETGAIVARNDNSVVATVTKNYAMATVSTITNNVGIISGYAYGNTVTTSNVVYSGSVSGTANVGRINGQQNGGPKYSNNLALSTVTVNGAVATGTITDRNGQSTPKATLELQKTYSDIGWDFSTIWTFDAAKARPVLTAVPELKAEDVEIIHESEVSVASPDGATTALVFVDQFAHLGYQVVQNGEVVVGNSRLGLVIDGIDYGSNVTLGSATEYSNSESYDLIGTRDGGVDNHNGSSIPVIKSGSSQLAIDIRVFDTGVALQYVLDSSLAGKTVTKEATTFAFDPTSTINYQDVTDSTIDDLQNTWSRSTFSAIGTRNITVLPTIQLPGNSAYVNVAEANVANWPALALTASGTGSISTYYWATDNGKGTFAVSPDTLHSPWRVLTIADNLDDFTNSDIITSVSDPVTADLFTDAHEWITPGVSVWMPQNGVGFTSTPKDFRTFIDASAKVGIEYVTVEEISDPSWGSTMAAKFQTLRDLVDYGLAKEKPVRIWLWSDYDFGNGTDQAFLDTITYTTDFADKDSLVNPDFRNAYLDLVKSIGIDGLKIDHIGNETETKVNFYGDFLVSAAERQMMVIYHNPLAPSGLNRTYPNELGREAIRGIQYNYDATLDTIMPFTRLIAGVADFTPLTFSNTSKLNNVTWTHQLASAIIYSSPYLQVSEVPTTMVEGAKFEYELRDFVENVPTTWTSSEVLPESEIGSLAAFVRQSSDNEWYIAAQAAAGSSRDFEVDLSFLPEGVEYNADVYTDSTVAASLKRETKKVTRDSVLTAKLSSGGGYVVRITTDEINNPLDNPAHYEISSEADLDLIRQHPTASFEFTSDIEMTTPFEPIPFFRGTIDGNGHEIANLVVGGRDSASKALIVDNSGTIRELGLSHATATRTGGYVESIKVAALVVTNRGLIDQVYSVDTTVAGGWRTAAIAAENQGTVSNSYATGTVSSNWEAGAVVAWNSATAKLLNTYADATVTAVVNNAGVVSGYGYAGTVFTGNVALGGSVRGVDNVGRVNGRENGMPTYSRNRASEAVTVNGLEVNGSLTDKQGLSIVPADLGKTSTYADLGWDFDTVWTYSTELDRPVLRANAEIDPIVPPVVTITDDELVVQAGTSPTTADLTDGFGASIDKGELTFDTAAVDITKAGVYPVSIGGSFSGVAAEPKTVSLRVVPVVAISTTSTTVTIAHASTLTSAILFEKLGATLNVPGEISVDTSSVDTRVAGSYPVTLRATDGYGFDASAVAATVVVEAAPEPEPAATTLMLTRTKSAQVYGSTAVATVTATVSGGDGSPAGSVEFQRGGVTVATVAVEAGVARYALPKNLAVATWTVTARFVSGEPGSADSAANSTTVVVKKSPAVATLSITDRTLAGAQRAKATIRVKAATGVVVSGTVYVYDGSKRIKTIALYTSANGTVKATLPKLAKGSHLLKVVYSGSTTVLTDTSPRVKATVR